MGHLDLFFKVIELFIEFTLLTGYLENNSTLVLDSSTAARGPRPLSGTVN